MWEIVSSGGFGRRPQIAGIEAREKMRRDKEEEKKK